MNRDEYEGLRPYAQATRGDLAVKALQPFVAAFKKYEDPGTADLDDEQPVHITVTLGDLRRAERALR